MQATTAGSAVLQKTRELCQTILDQPEYQKIRQGLDGFLGDDQLRDQYQLLSEKGETLQQKQQSGGQLTDQEIAEFESERQAFMQNPVARSFLEAQHEMQRMQESLTHNVNKTIELGRVPEETEFASCGHGCNCHH